MVILLSILLGIFLVSFGVVAAFLYTMTRDFLAVRLYVLSLEYTLYDVTKRQTYVEDFETWKWSTRDANDPSIDRILERGK